MLRQKQNVLASELGADGDGDGDTPFQRLTDAAHEEASPEDQLEKKRQFAVLHAAIRTLPSEQKDALILQQFNDLSLNEIADVTAVPVETVKSRLRYAMQKLRSQLQNMTVQGEVA